MEGVAHCELAHVELAQEHRSSIFELGHHRRVVVRHVFAENRRPSSGQHPIGAELVFDRDGDAVKWAAVVTGGDFRLRLPGLGSRLLGGDRNVGVQGGVDLLDARKVGLRRIHRRYFAGLEHIRQFGGS